MTPESGLFLEKSREFLAKAADMLADEWPDEAGRAAYLAGMHAAQALIFERTGKIMKRHRGVHGEFARLAREMPGLDAELRAFLGRAYNLKTAADYETGPAAQVSEERARAMLASATRFVGYIAQVLS